MVSHRNDDNPLIDDAKATADEWLVRRHAEPPIESTVLPSRDLHAEALAACGDNKLAMRRVTGARAFRAAAHAKLRGSYVEDARFYVDLYRWVWT